MSAHRTLKHIHIASTAWFILCVGLYLVLALPQAGIRWWVVLSLSGHGALIVLVLVSLYLFAIFRGISSSQKVRLEHPLTSTTYYAVFYVATPFLGGLAGCLGMMGGVGPILEFLLGVALGTFGTTFLVWVILDPVIGLLETLLPASREHRAQRLVQARAERQSRQRNRERFLAHALAKEESDRSRWQEMLKPHAEKLAGPLATDTIDFKQAEREAVGIGASAWQIGGLNCMRELRDMATAMCRQENQNRTIADYINSWWDGIGSWRAPSLG